MKIAAIFLLSFFLTTCSDNKPRGWTAEEKKEFMNECVPAAKKGIDEDKAAPYCECMANKLEKKYPKYAEAGKITMSETVEMAKDCLK